MKQVCFDEGTMQAFLDGELSAQLLEKVARHVALCEPCAALLQETEEESAFAFAALDNEINSLVPTERIRTNLYQAISEIEKPKTSLWVQFLNLGAIFSNPSIAAFAGLIIVGAIFVTIWSFKNQPHNSTDLAGKSAPTTPSNDVVPIVQTQGNETISNNPQFTSPIDVQQINQPTVKRGNQTKAQNAVYKLSNTNNLIQRTKNGDSKVTPQSAETISGEDTYIKTIASLTETVNGQKDIALRPSARVSFEKDLAIADDTISKMKQEVKKNPKNEAAKQVLRNSYQNKIDLLNSVTEKSELMVALKD
jgi:Putative zinc-finger